MISGIDRKSGLEIFLEPDEIDRLLFEPVEGSLIKIDSPKNQGILSVSVNELRKYEKGIGIGFDDRDYSGIDTGFRLSAFISKSLYEQFVENGTLDMHHRMGDGGKVYFYDIAGLDIFGKKRMKLLEIYKNNLRDSHM